MASKDKTLCYKTSKFTYILKTKDTYILYNSLIGINSIRKVSKNHASLVDRYLYQSPIDYFPDPFLDKLIEYGYMIPTEEDETTVLRDLYSRCTYNNTLNLTLLPTEQCNFRCKYCYENFERTRMNEATISALIQFVRKNIHRYTGLRVSWFGGEPTLEIDMITRLSKAFQSICKKAKRPYWASITTNGFLLNQQTFEKLYKCNVFRYQITIDGTKDTHDLQRPLVGGEGSFNKIVQNLINIKTHKRYRHWFITIRTNFSKDIYEIMDQYIEFYANLFNDDDRFTFLVRPAGDWGGERVKQYRDHMFQEDGLSRVFQKMLDSKQTLNIKRHLSFLNPGGSQCMAAKANAYLVDSHGTIRKCSCHLDDDRNKIGSIDSQGDFHVDRYQRARWLFFNVNETRCQDCWFLPACLNSACPAEYVLNRSNTDVCHVYEKNHIDYILLLLDKMQEVPEVVL